MNFTIERQALLNALSRVVGIAGRSSVVICRHVLIEAGVDQITLRTTNLDMEATTTVGADVTKIGSTCAPADTLLNIAKNAIDGADISFELADRLIVKSGRSRFQVAVLPASDFPDFSSVDGEVIEMRADDMAELLGRCAFSAGVDAAKFILTGVHLFSQGDKLGSVATNIKRMTLYETDDGAIDFAITVPRPMIDEATKLLAGDAETAELIVGKTKISVTFRQTSITSKLLDGPYPDFRRVIPTKWDAALTVNREALSGAIRRAQIASDDNAFSVKLIIAPGVIKVTARGQDLEAADECECEYDGDERTIGMNSAQVLEALTAAKSDNIEIKINNGVGGHVMVRGVGDETYKAIIMPLRIGA